MGRQKRGFRDHKDPTEGLKNQLKMEVGNEYVLKFPVDILEQWEEVWPTFNGPDGRITRRFVSDEDGANLKPLHQYKKEIGIPKDLDKNDTGNWKPKSRYGSIVLVGTEQVVKVEGKKKKRISWDKGNPKIFLFGIDIFRQLTAINNNVDLQETMEEKGFSTEKFNCTDVFYFRITKSKKGKENWQVEYDVQAGKPIGQFKAGSIDLEEIEKELYDFIDPSKESDLEEFLEGSGDAGSGNEPESVDETEDQTVEPDSGDELDIPDLDEETEPDKPKSGKDKGGKKAEPKDDDDLGLEDDQDNNSESSSESSSDELDLDDIDGLLDD